MNTGLFDLLGIGGPAILLGLVALVAMVQMELGPFSQLSGGGKWLLTGAFGSGVLAFGFKLLVAVLIARFPEQVVDSLVAAAPRHRAVSDGTTDTGLGAPLPAAGSGYAWQALPAEAPAPPDNPTTPEKADLGRRLFFETRLSGDGNLACSSCHDLLAKAGGDGLPTAVGIHGRKGGRNTPTVWNAAFQSVLFWDGRARSLEAQARGPILNPLEMGLPEEAVAEERLSADPGYRSAFAAAFGDETITFARITQAIAAFERTLVTPDTPYDRFVTGDSRALNPAQLRGMGLFESLGCVNCHRGPAFSDSSLLGGRLALRLFPATGVLPPEARQLAIDSGAAPRGSRPGVWRVPSLRNVALTGPYFHNGSVRQLKDAVRIMASAQLGRTGERRFWLGEGQSLRQADRSPLQERELEDLVAFLEALSSDRLVAGRP